MPSAVKLGLAVAATVVFGLAVVAVLALSLVLDMVVPPDQERHR